ncbi:cupin-like domain-containing protein [Asticcacaulis machinosus]|uniref:Cupin-like domain-containing protein n=1 Tax=Asticcacaulis machinosus TaxID=2984211 RepID=A0ABT5HHE5_9CAUL|nr:cupin-like domain-containing protein [Asticcacaulis machinosus]MDC7675580.1 cupin-like domain-containing protein [Asticcacaulis machinosus]
MRPVDTLTLKELDQFQILIKTRRLPFVIRGFAKDWPAVNAARASDEAFCKHLLSFDSGQPFETVIAPPEAKGRYFYDDKLTAFNFNRQSVPLNVFLEHLLHLRNAPNPHTLFIQSTLADDRFPGFSDVNINTVLPHAAGRLWIGNRTRVATHFDVADNLAVVLAGRRQFTLFPPDQVANLYVGPLDFTPAGQPVSLADPTQPDYDTFPRFKNAMNAAMSCKLEPGDAIYIPSPWWHHVEAMTGVNTLINYWWRDYPAECGNPFNWLVHGLLSVRHLPRAEREAWRSLISHYIFEDNGDPAAHIPQASRSALKPMDNDLAERLRAWLITTLDAAKP